MHTLEVVSKVLDVLLHLLPLALIIVPILARRFIADADKRAKLDEAVRITAMAVAAADREVRAARAEGGWTAARSAALANAVHDEIIRRLGPSAAALESQYGAGIIDQLVEAEGSRLERGVSPPADAGRPSAPPAP